MNYLERFHYEPEYNPSRLKWDISRASQDQYEKFWGEKTFQLIPKEHFEQEKPIWLEVGAGSGFFFAEMARLYPDRFLIAIERSKMRGLRLVRKVARTPVSNLAGYRGNAIPALIHGVPSERLERLYLLYPCPWPKNAQRKNRWYLHPIMPHLLRALKPGGLMVWASDQKFYIDEARFVCETVYGMKVLVHGQIAPNAYNDLAQFDGGRSKFEQTFLKQGQPCYELVVEKLPAREEPKGLLS
jgi:tRNA (guanine-N7-)-methyltransferase